MESVRVVALKTRNTYVIIPVRARALSTEWKRMIQELVASIEPMYYNRETIFNRIGCIIDIGPIVSRILRMPRVYKKRFCFYYFSLPNISVSLSKDTRIRKICKNFFTRAFFFFWFHSIFRKIPYTETIVRYRQNVRENLYDPMERRRYSWNQVRVSLQTNFSYGGKREKLKYISVTFFLLFFSTR